MAKIPDGKSLDKLPQWAKDYCRNLIRERDAACNALNAAMDSQTKAPMKVREMISDGQSKYGGPSIVDRYIQGHSFELTHAGVSLNIILRDSVIDLQWGTADRFDGDVMFQPCSYQGAYLFPPGKKR